MLRRPINHEELGSIPPAAPRLRRHAENFTLLAGTCAVIAVVSALIAWHLDPSHVADATTSTASMDASSSEDASPAFALVTVPVAFALATIVSTVLAILAHRRYRRLVKEAS